MFKKSALFNSVRQCESEIAWDCVGVTMTADYLNEEKST